MTSMSTIFTAFSFIVFTVTPSLSRVPDVDPPSITCPADIEIKTTKTSIIVNWDLPKVLWCDRRRGVALPSPGTYVVQCYNNKNKPLCSFTIKIRAPQCIRYQPPKNGALVCVDIGHSKLCAAFCNKKYDFAFIPGQLYYCGRGTWHVWGPLFNPGPQRRLPWPDCSVKSPSSIKSVQFPFYYYGGDVNDPNVQHMIKQNFLQAMHPPYFPPIFCIFNPECKLENIYIMAGKNV